MGQAWAGVVEDAEEELKKMGKGQEQLVVSGSDRRAGNSPTRNVSSRTRQESRPGAEPGRKGRAKQRDTDSGSASGSVAADLAEPETAMPSGRNKKDQRDKNKGRLASAGVVLFLILLVLLATAASRRLGSNE